MHSPTYGKLTLEQAIERIYNFISSRDGSYKFIIGTDSQTVNGCVVFVTALIVHRVGNGGIYFYDKRVVDKKFSLADRMFTEVSYSIQLASELLEKIDENLYSFYEFLSDLEIHVDVGRDGETRELINAVVGMVKGNGYRVKCKPEAYAASKVADKHTRTLSKFKTRRVTRVGKKRVNLSK